MDSGLVDLLRQLVAIPSVSPGEGEDPACTGEQRIAEFLAGLLEARGFSVQLDNSIPGRPNLLASYGPASARRTILFESHLDTVGVTGMSVPPFEARMDNGRLYGRGACDTKGPMAAALAAFTPDVLDPLVSADCRVLFAGAMGEETGNIGALRMVEQGLRADYAVVLEPTELAIVYTHKGALWLELETVGVAGHGSNPDRGLNAIAGMTRALEFLDRQIAAHGRDRQHPVLGRPTLNVGLIRGGRAVNIVPDRCVIQVDRRTLPGEDHAAILADMRAGLDDLRSRGVVESAELRVLKDSPPFQTSADAEIVDALRRSCERAGVAPRAEGAAWHSDAGCLSTVCPQTVVFGPGSIQQAHTADEYIDLDGLQAGFNIIKALLTQLAGGVKQSGGA